jgi:hypothetical protein
VFTDYSQKGNRNLVRVGKTLPQYTPNPAGGQFDFVFLPFGKSMFLSGLYPCAESGPWVIGDLAATDGATNASISWLRGTKTISHLPASSRPRVCRISGYATSHGFATRAAWKPLLNHAEVVQFPDITMNS